MENLFAGAYDVLRGGADVGSRITKQEEQAYPRPREPAQLNACPERTDGGTAK
ncbi:hypothetical protein BaRGS_00007051, partial [Batillaria attramentaria]